MDLEVLSRIYIYKEYDTSLMFLQEIHASRVSANRIIPWLGFDSYFIQDGRGQSRGIWCLWNSEMWKVEILQSDFQFVHLKLRWKKQASWLLTVVYGSPNFQHLKAL